MQMSRYRRFQQSLSRQKSKRRSVLRHESHAEKIYKRKPKRKYHRKRKKHHGNVKSPIHSQT